jgi:hypothetical protein
MENAERKVIGGWVISNVSSLNVYEMSHSNDGMLVGINGLEPEWVEIQYTLDEEARAYIEYRESQWHLDECMRY